MQIKVSLWRYSLLCTVHKLFFITRFLFPTAAADGDDGFTFHTLLLSVSCLPVCHHMTRLQREKNIKSSPKSGQKQSEPLTPTLLYIKQQLSAGTLHSFISPPSLSASVYISSIHVRQMWGSGLVPTPSQWNSWFQLGPLLGPYVHVHAHTLTHAENEWGSLLSLAQRSVERVIESLDQNISGAGRCPALAVVTALCLSIRLGWSGSR